MAHPNKKPARKRETLAELCVGRVLYMNGSPWTFVSANRCISCVGFFEGRKGKLHARDDEERDLWKIKLSLATKGRTEGNLRFQRH